MQFIHIIKHLRSFISFPSLSFYSEHCYCPECECLHYPVLFMGLLAVISKLHMIPPSPSYTNTLFILLLNINIAFLRWVMGGDGFCFSTYFLFVKPPQWNRSKLCWSYGRDREVQRNCSWEKENFGGREGVFSKSCLHCFRHAEQQGHQLKACKVYHFFCHLFVWYKTKYSWERVVSNRCIDDEEISHVIHSLLFPSYFLHDKSTHSQDDIFPIYLNSSQNIYKWSFSLKAFKSSTWEPSAVRILFPLFPNFSSASTNTTRLETLKLYTHESWFSLQFMEITNMSS